MPHRFLVLDDQLIQREHIKSLFIRAGELQVDTAETADQALGMIERARYDLVLSDLLMPGLDGVQFIQRLSRSSQRPALALMSSSSQLILGANTVADALGMRVLDRVFKPATPEAIDCLLNRLRELEVAPDVCVHSPSHASLSLASILEAIESRRIQAWYQPKLNISEGRIGSAEALVRWVNPDGSVLLPAYFLPSIVAFGLEEVLLHSVIEQAIEAQGSWRRRGFEVGVSVNLPTHLLDDPELPDRLHAMVVRAGGDPEDVCFELTESSMTRDLSDFYAGACRLRIKGFGLAQDDCGLGYSSLLNAISTPFTEIKIDQSLVRQCVTASGSRAAVESIVALGNKIGVEVVAEGVESWDQFSVLKNAGCNWIQGFLVSRALTKDLFSEFVSGRSFSGL